MYELTLSQLRDCITHDDRPAALRVLRTAISNELIAPRDGIELMLAVRNAAQDTVMEAIGTMGAGLPGTYRYVPKAEYAFA